MTRHLAAVADLGGVNSIRSFTRSWARAAGFAEVIPQRPSFIFAPDQEPMAGDDLDYSRSHVGATPEPRSSLLRQHLEAFNPGNGEGASRNSDLETSPLVYSTSHQSDFRERERKASEQDMPGTMRHGSSSFSGGRRPSIFAIAPHLATPPLVGSYGSYRTYGTLPDVEDSSMAQAGEMWRQQQEGGTNVPDGEHQPILVKEVEQDGKIVLTVDGQSTLPQTIFNSIKYVPRPHHRTPWKRLGSWPYRARQLTGLVVS